ncbi:carbohydrate kinase, YjeF related protein [Haladaptatus paucihalophilus DX253]|uniref:Bifunctional NAD(P)H-hydrate repair enzyme n=1 Tax=Haladaptatus paucihalophilus DX253 TaxID=797209 RepID=E7QPU0_HALPU|nr:bifunctional ADP-dependent NAD(P)H-hydrate dehydratase/NAD(P)H-hydrate epimerase [Haladaptatus paucihalophilus]EFW93016.1 carbohydrate kinase, YjeF related protein [Haladaptatus paucihalophilus DX253]SHL69664.1 NAD(P)H-hydrate epimerase [Haladaptatus paucihalophilus DX253]
MITADRMAAVDENAEHLGVPRKQLMESSGNAIARRVREMVSPGARVCIVAGRGNNGGDAFVAARFLDEYDVSVLLLGRAETIGTDIARENWDALRRAEYDATEVKDSGAFELPDCDLVIDAMLGTGVTGALREPAATVARAINDADAAVLAVDVPSGVNADSGEAEGVAVEADAVVTFHDMKPGLADHDGDVTVADIGIPAAAERFVGPGDLRSVRGDVGGRVFVIGGGPFTGAPALAAQSALRAGADLSFVAAPNTVAGEIQGYAEDLIVQPYDGDRLTPEQVDGLVETAESYDDTVIIGPGLGNADETIDAATDFLESFEGRAVVDADALPAIPGLDTDATLVCTPNRKELAEMDGPDADDLREVTDEIETLADDIGHVVLAKGATDVISDGDRTRVVRTGNTGMKVGGTGDLLAGIVAGLFGTTDAFDAACVGSFVNGRAGDLLYDERYEGLLASDMLETIPAAMWGEDDA